MEGEKVSIPRYRGSRLNKVKKMDIFPKIEDPYKMTSSVGGTCEYYLHLLITAIELAPIVVSIVTFLIIGGLLYSEITYYLNSRFVFKFSPDVELEEKLKINIDLTVAMPCGCKNIIKLIVGCFKRKKIVVVGTDVLDSTNQNTYKFGQLEEEDTWFELSDNQKLHFENKKHFNSYLREEYHAIKV